MMTAKHDIMATFLRGPVRPWTDSANIPYNAYLGLTFPAVSGTPLSIAMI